MYPNLVKVVTVALLLIAPSSARAVVVPMGLTPGDTYHLAFLTAGTQNAVSTSILTYNAFVQAQAAMNSGLTGAGLEAGLGVDWFVIGSTHAVDARVNALVSAPVYLLDGITKVADGFTDMWDDGDGIDNPIIIDQYGDPVINPDPIFTGSDPNGTESFPNPSTQRFLGSTQTIRIGDPSATNSDWISDPGTSDPDDQRSFYALSELLTVVPEPTAGSLIAFGMLAVLWCRRRAPKR